MSLPEPIIQPQMRQVHLALNPKGGVGKSLIMAKQRLKLVRDDIFNQLNHAL